MEADKKKRAKRDGEMNKLNDKFKKEIDQFSVTLSDKHFQAMMEIRQKIKD